MEKLGIIRTVAGLDIMTLENFIRISGSPSRYQIGDLLYMGGQTKKVKSGRASQHWLNFSRNSSITGSERMDTESEAGELVMKLVMQDMMQRFDSGRMEPNAAERRDKRPHGMTWAPVIRGRSRQFIGFMWR